MTKMTIRHSLTSAPRPGYPDYKDAIQKIETYRDKIVVRTQLLVPSNYFLAVDKAERLRNYLINRKAKDTDGREITPQDTIYRNIKTDWPRRIEYDNDALDLLYRVYVKTLWNGHDRQFSLEIPADVMISQVGMKDDSFSFRLPFYGNSAYPKFSEIE